MSSILQSRRRRREALTGWAFAAPAAAVIIVLFLIPLVLAAWMSLNDWPLIGEPSFNAPDNFVAMTQNKLFTGAIAFTVKYTVVVVLIYLVGGLGLALLVQNRRRGVGIFRTAYLMPAAVGLASSSLLFYALYNNDYSPLDDILRALRLVQGNPEFLGTPDKAFASTVVLVAWRFVGFTMIILLTGLQAIPVDIYAASAPPDDPAGPRSQRHGVAAGLRTVLRRDGRRPEQQHSDDGDGDVPRGFHPVPAGHRRRDCDDAACGPRADQRPAAHPVEGA
jgi:ABC-type sugar transport system permease subunit